VLITYLQFQTDHTDAHQLLAYCCYVLCLNDASPTKVYEKLNAKWLPRK